MRKSCVMVNSFCYLLTVCVSGHVGYLLWVLVRVSVVGDTVGRILRAMLAGTGMSTRGTLVSVLVALPMAGW